ncbi:MAG: tRNA-cytidine(32) 2-sulfurtransferase [Chlamydiia bacterium]|nr:tRNA-cytidine(32) 2-sulfurtransferase [Chlamydiia bacterium]MCH9616079.1 tRNA-cytidine(32) 2-sulfurtransferase [Chlamydiia bacterium]MCH9629102.1 tRNA-cytidine(32) 2-sulfurtransferase [Chlamydiia bacterium]
MTGNLALKIHLPLARPPWTQLGRKLESMCRKAIYDYNLLEGVDHLAIALSGGKDSLTLLYLLKAISGKGVQDFKVTAIHVDGAFSCGAGLDKGFLDGICRELGVDLVRRTVDQKRELECYTCSRKRRTLIFEAAKEVGATSIAFGHHRDDSIQTLLMNLFHKAEFAANLPKVHMRDYGVTITRPLIYVSEKQIIEFAKLYGFQRITCQCPVGANSMRKQTEAILKDIERTYPNVRTNLATCAKLFGSEKAKDK